MSRRLGYCLAIALSLVVAVLVTIWAAADPFGIPYAKGDSAMPSVRIAEGLLEKLMQEASAPPAPGPVSSEESGHGAVARADNAHARAGKQPCDWPRSLVRSDHNLAKSVIQCTVDARELIRHEWMNPRDLPICPEQEAEIDALVAQCISVVKPLTMHLRQTMMNEQMHMIDAGIVVPWNGDQGVSEKSIVALSRYYGGLGITKSREELTMELARNAKLHLGGPPGLRIFYKGEWYGRAAFPVLPETARVHELLCAGAAQAFAIPCNWFVANGFLLDSELIRCMEAFFLLSPP